MYNLKKIAVLVVLVLGTAACSDIIIQDTTDLPRNMRTDPMGIQKVRITTEPEGAKIMLISMGNRQMQTFYAPAEIDYMITPAMPTVVTVSSKGYKPKNVRLDGSKEEIHVILDKAIMLPTYDFGTSSKSMGGAPGIGRAPTDTGVGGGMSSGQGFPVDQGSK